MYQYGGAKMKYLIKKTPDGFIKTINDEINSILNRNFDSLFPEFIFTGEMDKYAMPVEIHEKDNEYKIKAELPGVKKEDLEIDIDKNHLSILAKKVEEHVEDTKSCRKSEFKYGDFSRVIYFPQEIDVEKTEAKLNNGVLHIEAPKMKQEKEKSKKLEVK